MTTILPKLNFFVKKRLSRCFRRCTDAGTRLRFLILFKLDAGRHPQAIADYLGVHRDTVYRVARRFRERGILGVLDGRAHNGPRKLSDDFLRALDWLVRGSPQEHGHRRPTWTRELLLKTLLQQGHRKVHLATLSRALRLIRARRGRPRPTVACPWAPSRKARRLKQILRLVQGLPADEVAVYEDEVDIHLNPKIGYDWMGYGQQKEVRTPGQNVKRYLAGALDVRGGQIHWVESDHKDSWLFVNLLGKLYLHYAQAKAIHVILDNYSIHDSRLVAWALLEAGGRIKLHPLPPYCPDDNKIERVWQDLHGEVTRNHTCPDMDTLMAEVRDYLRRRYEQILNRANTAHKAPAQG
jgi:transposase